MTDCLDPAPSRRTFLACSLAAAGLVGSVPSAMAATPLLVENVTGLYPVVVARAEAPRSAAQVSMLLRTWPGRVAVGGGRYSMGGQVAVEDGLHLDMRQMNRLVWLRPQEHTLAPRHEGRYYLPYRLHATKEQFMAAYLGVAEWRLIKQEVDSASKLSNELWRKVL